MVGASGCATTGRLKYQPLTVSPVPKDTTVRDVEGRARVIQTWRPMFSDTLVGLVPGTGDSTIRYLGRLRGGYTADTLNVIVFGDNRPGWRATRLQPEYAKLRKTFSWNPVNIVTGLIQIPIMLVKGLYPDLALVRDIPDKVRNMPTWGREKEVLSAMMTKIDSLHAQGQSVAAIINSGDLVDDGRVPAHWERFLKITEPLTSRVPYFPVAGNHERTDTPLGIENWRTATGLPASGDRLYYCFDSADGWVRFIALDTNPIVDPGKHYSREVQVKYSDEEFTWLVKRVQEHTGPVFVMMHHPPFSAGFHRDEWQRDSVLSERRERMMRALHESGIAVIVSGHEHAYQRAILTWPDAVAIMIATGGGGAPLHAIPQTPVGSQMFAQYHVAGAVVKPENVYTNPVFHFVLMRLWFGGGELYAYSVDAKSHSQLIDKVQIDLKRWGVPKIDQKKLPIPPSKGPKEPQANEAETAVKAAGADTAKADRGLTQPKPTVAKADTAHAKRPTTKHSSTAPRPSKRLTGAVAQPGE
jgi:hypothetical protein